MKCLEKSPAWKGWGKRFVLISACEHWKKVCEYIKEALPKESPHQDMVPSKMSAQLGTAMFGPAPPHPVLFDSSPAIKLGLLKAGKFIPVQDLVATNVKSLLENEFTHSSKYIPDK